MTNTRLYLQKNDTTKNSKLPYFTMKIVPEEGAKDQEWKEIGVFWKAKSGVGYTGFFSEGVDIDLTNLKPRPKKTEGGEAPVEVSND